MNTSPLRILIVEDTQDFRENLRKLLIRAFPGASVDCATTVESGKKLLSQTQLLEIKGRQFEQLIPVDVVILDFRLPDEMGVQEIDTSLCEIARMKHPNSLVIHVTANAGHEKAKAHVEEVHPSASNTLGGNSMETQHLGIVIEKGLPTSADPDDRLTARRLGREIVEAINRRQKLKLIDAGLSQLLEADDGDSSGNRRAMGRVAVPDSGLTGHVGTLSLALEEAWHWLPERTKNRARQLFTVHDVPNAPGKVYIQML